MPETLQQRLTQSPIVSTGVRVYIQDLNEEWVDFTGRSFVDGSDAGAVTDTDDPVSIASVLNNNPNGDKDYFWNPPHKLTTVYLSNSKMVSIVEHIHYEAANNYDELQFWYSDNHGKTWRLFTFDDIFKQTFTAVPYYKDYEIAYHIELDTIYIFACIYDESDYHAHLYSIPAETFIIHGATNQLNPDLAGIAVLETASLALAFVPGSLSPGNLVSIKYDEFETNDLIVSWADEVALGRVVNISVFSPAATEEFTDAPSTIGDVATFTYWYGVVGYDTTKYFVGIIQNDIIGVQLNLGYLELARAGGAWAFVSVSADVDDYPFDYKVMPLIINAVRHYYLKLVDAAPYDLDIYASNGSRYVVATGLAAANDHYTLEAEYDNYKSSTTICNLYAYFWDGNDATPEVGQCTIQRRIFDANTNTFPAIAEDYYEFASDDAADTFTVVSLNAATLISYTEGAETYKTPYSRVINCFGVIRTIADDVANPDTDTFVDMRNLLYERANSDDYYRNMRLKTLSAISIKNEGVFLDSNFITSVSSITFDNSDGFFNKPIGVHATQTAALVPGTRYKTILKTTLGNPAEFQISRDGRATVFANQKLKISLRVIYRNLTEDENILVVLRVAQITERTMESVTFKLEDLAKKYRDTTALPIRDGYNWIRGKPFSYVIRRVIQHVEDVITIPTNYLFPSTISFPTRGRIYDPDQKSARDYRKISSLGRPPHIIIEDDTANQLYPGHSAIVTALVNWTFVDTAIVVSNVNYATELSYSNSAYVNWWSLGVGQNGPRPHDSIVIRNSKLGNDGAYTIRAVTLDTISLETPLKGKAETFYSSLNLQTEQTAIGRDENEIAELDTDGVPVPKWSVSRVFLGIEGGVVDYNPWTDRYIKKYIDFLPTVNSLAVYRLWNGPRRAYAYSNIVIGAVWERRAPEPTVVNTRNYCQDLFLYKFYANASASGIVALINVTNSANVIPGDFNYRIGRGADFTTSLTPTYEYGAGLGQFHYTVGDTARQVADNEFHEYFGENLCIPFSQYISNQNYNYSPTAQIANSGRMIGTLDFCVDFDENQDTIRHLLYPPIFNNYPITGILPGDRIKDFYTCKAINEDIVAVSQSKNYLMSLGFSLGQHGCVIYQPNYGNEGTVAYWIWNGDEGTAIGYTQTIGPVVKMRKYDIFTEAESALAGLSTDLDFGYFVYPSIEDAEICTPVSFMPTAGCHEPKIGWYTLNDAELVAAELVDGDDTTGRYAALKINDVIYFAGMGWIENTESIVDTSKQGQFSTSLIGAVHLDSTRRFNAVSIDFSSMTAGYFILTNVADVPRFKRGQVVRITPGVGDPVHRIVRYIDINTRYITVDVTTDVFLGGGTVDIVVDILYHSHYEHLGAMGNGDETANTWINFGTEDENSGFLSDNHLRFIPELEEYEETLEDAHKNTFSILEITRNYPMHANVGLTAAQQDTEETLVVSLIERKSVATDHFAYVVGIRGSAYWNAWTAFGRARANSRLKKPPQRLTDPALPYYAATTADNYPGFAFGDGQLFRFRGPVRGFVVASDYPNYDSRETLRNPDNSAIFAVEGQSGRVIKLQKHTSFTAATSAILYVGSEFYRVFVSGGFPPAMGAVYATSNLAYNGWFYTLQHIRNNTEFYSNAVMGTVFGASGPNPNIGTMVTGTLDLASAELTIDRSGSYVFWKYDLYLAMYGDIFDFTDMNCWEVLENLAQASNSIVGFSGDSFFFMPRTVSPVANFTLDCNSDSKLLSTLEVASGEDEIINVASVTASGSKREDSSYEIVMVPRNSYEEELSVGVEIRNTNDYPLRLRLQCLRTGYFGSGIEEPAIFRYSMTEDLSMTVYLSAATDPRTVIPTGDANFILVNGAITDLKQDAILEILVEENGEKRIAQAQVLQTPNFDEIVNGTIWLRTLNDSDTPCFEWIIGESIAEDVVFPEGSEISILSGLPGWSDSGNETALFFGDENADFENCQLVDNQEDVVPYQGYLASTTPANNVARATIFPGWYICNLYYGVDVYTAHEHVVIYPSRRPFSGKRAFAMVREIQLTRFGDLLYYLWSAGFSYILKAVTGFPAETQFHLSFYYRTAQTAPRGRTVMQRINVYIDIGDGAGFTDITGAAYLESSVRLSRFIYSGTSGASSTIWIKILPISSSPTEFDDFDDVVGEYQYPMHQEVLAGLYNTLEADNSGITIDHFSFRRVYSSDVTTHLAFFNKQIFYPVGTSGVYLKFIAEQQDEYGNIGMFKQGDIIDIVAGGITKSKGFGAKSAMDLVSKNMYGERKKEINSNPFISEAVAEDLAAYIVDLYADPGSIIKAKTPLTAQIQVINSIYSVLNTIGVRSPVLFPMDFMSTRFGYPRAIGHDLTMGSTSYEIKEVPSRRVEQRRAPDAYGPELIANGTFDSGDNWTADANWTIAGGVATHAAGNTSQVYQVGLNIIPQMLYRVAFTVSGYVAETVYVLLFGDNSPLVSANGEYVFYLMGKAHEAKGIRFYPSINFVGAIDNVSVRRVYNVLLATK